MLSPERRVEIARLAALARWRGMPAKEKRTLVNVTLTLSLDYIASPARIQEIAARALYDAHSIVAKGGRSGCLFDRVSGHIGNFVVVTMEDDAS